MYFHVKLILIACIECWRIMTLTVLHPDNFIMISCRTCPIEGTLIMQHSYAYVIMISDEVSELNCNYVHSQ